MSDSEREKVILENKNLVYLVLKNMGLYKYQKEFEDLCFCALIKGVDTYNSKYEIKISTYLTKCIKNAILTELNRRKREINTISLNMIINEGERNTTELNEIIKDPDIDIEKEVIFDEIFQRINKRLSKLDKRDCEIFKELYGIDGRKKLSNKELGIKYNCSHQNITLKCKKIINMLRFELKDYFVFWNEI